MFNSIFGVPYTKGLNCSEAEKICNPSNWNDINNFKNILSIDGNNSLITFMTTNREWRPCVERFDFDLYTSRLKNQ